MKAGGVVRLSRISIGGGGMDLFGSKIPVNTAISLEISEAEEGKSFGSASIHGKFRPLIEVTLTPNQFSEMLTTMNVGAGVPCTLRHVEGKEVEPFEKTTNARKISEAFLKEILGELDEKIVAIQKTAGSLKIPKKAKEDLEHQIDVLRHHFSSNIPFVDKVFKEEMDKVVVEAKADVDALVTHTVTQLGLESLKGKQYLIEE